MFILFLLERGRMTSRRWDFMSHRPVFFIEQIGELLREQQEKKQENHFINNTNEACHADYPWTQSTFDDEHTAHIQFAEDFLVSYDKEYRHIFDKPTHMAALIRQQFYVPFRLLSAIKEQSLFPCHFIDMMHFLEVLTQKRKMIIEKACLMHRHDHPREGILKRHANYFQWIKTMAFVDVLKPPSHVHRLLLLCRLENENKDEKRILCVLDLREKDKELLPTQICISEQQHIYYKWHAIYEKSDYEPNMLLLQSNIETLLKQWVKATSGLFGFRHALIKKIDEALSMYVEHYKIMQTDEMTDCLRELVLLMQIYQRIITWLQERRYINSAHSVWTLYSLIIKRFKKTAFHSLDLIYCVNKTTVMNVQLFSELAQIIEGGTPLAT